MAEPTTLTQKDLTAEIEADLGSRPSASFRVTTPTERAALSEHNPLDNPSVPAELRCCGDSSF